jgi:hypothetical protein
MAFMLILLTVSCAYAWQLKTFELFFIFFEKTLKFLKVAPLPIQTGGNGL